MFSKPTVFLLCAFVCFAAASDKPLLKKDKVRSYDENAVNLEDSLYDESVGSQPGYGPTPFYWQKYKPYVDVGLYRDESGIQKSLNVAGNPFFPGIKVNVRPYPGGYVSIKSQTGEIFKPLVGASASDAASNEEIPTADVGADTKRSIYGDYPYYPYYGYQGSSAGIPYSSYYSRLWNLPLYNRYGSSYSYPQGYSGESSYYPYKYYPYYQYQGQGYYPYQYQDSEYTGYPESEYGYDRVPRDVEGGKKDKKSVKDEKRITVDESTIATDSLSKYPLFSKLYGYDRPSSYYPEGYSYGQGYYPQTYGQGYYGPYSADSHYPSYFQGPYSQEYYQGSYPYYPYSKQGYYPYSSQGYSYPYSQEYYQGSYPYYSQTYRQGSYPQGYTGFRPYSYGSGYSSYGSGYSGYGSGYGTGYGYGSGYGSYGRSIYQGQYPFYKYGYGYQPYSAKSLVY